MGELPLPPYDSCRLASLVLLSYVINPFTPNAEFDIERFKKDAYDAQIIMDIIVDMGIERSSTIISKLEREKRQFVSRISITGNSRDYGVFDDEIKMWKVIRDMAADGRRTGLGVMGLADALAALNLKYGTPEAIQFTDSFMSSLALSSYKASIDLAEERGAFPVCNKEAEIDRADEVYYFYNIRNLIKIDDREYLDKWEKYGRRNIQNLAIAPTGTISMMAGVSSGIEPIFNIRYKRRRRAANDSKNTFTDKDGNVWEEFYVIHKPFLQWAEANNIGGDFQNMSDKEFDRIVEMSPYYKAGTYDIDPYAKIILQATAQRWVDHSISITHNLPKGTKPEKIRELIIFAYQQGVKGFTVYVDGSRVGIIVSKDDNGGKDKRAATKRPKKLNADIHTTYVHGEKWVVIVGILDGSPYEIFAFKLGDKDISIKQGIIEKVKSKKYKLLDLEGNVIVENIIDAFETPEEEFGTRLISTSLRHGANIKFIYEQLQKSSGDITHFSKAIARILKKYIPGNELASAENVCPICGSKNVSMSEGCVSCKDCGWSKCG